MKAVLEFNLPEDQSDFEVYSNGPNYHNALRDTFEEVFRPHRKHGYNNPKLEKLAKMRNVSKAIDMLEDMFLEILKERDIKLYE